MLWQPKLSPGLEVRPENRLPHLAGNAVLASPQVMVVPFVYQGTSLEWSGVLWDFSGDKISALAALSVCRHQPPLSRAAAFALGPTSLPGRDGRASAPGLVSGHTHTKVLIC